MTQIKFLLGMLCAYAAYYAIVILSEQKRQKKEIANAGEETASKDEIPSIESWMQKERNADTVLVHDAVVRSLYAYDNSNHNKMVHVRFDAQTVDLLNKFKMATGTDMTKFVAFAVKYLFESNPELKNIIKLYLQNTKL